MLTDLSQQVDVLRQSSERVSSSAEVYGAVQQEARISRAIEIMLLHVDNLKRIYEKEHNELEEAKKYVDFIIRFPIYGYEKRFINHIYEEHFVKIVLF